MILFTISVMKIIACKIHRLPIVPVTNVSTRTAFDWLRRKKDEKETDLEEDFALEKFEQQSRWAHLTDEEVARIQDKSRLPDEVRMEIKGIPHLGTKLRHLDHYRRDNIRKYWATYGEASGLKPGVCWPNKSELEFKMKFEETFYPSFQEMVERKKKEREAKEADLKKYRSDILTKLKQLPKIRQDFMKKYDQKVEEGKQELIKREKLIQEVREYLGYNVAPGDTRFQEALQKMEEENKAVAKASKKQEKQAKILAQLAAMASEDIKKADAQIASEKDGQPAKDSQTEKKTKE